MSPVIIKLFIGHLIFPGFLLVYNPIGLGIPLTTNIFCHLGSLLFLAAFELWRITFLCLLVKLFFSRQGVPSNNYWAITVV